MTEINSTNVNNLISNDVAQFMIKMANTHPKQKLNDQQMRDMNKMGEVIDQFKEIDQLIKNDISELMITVANNLPIKRERSEKQKLNDQRMRDMHLEKKIAKDLHYKHITETIQVIDNMDKISELLAEVEEIDQIIKEDIINEKEITNDIIENKENINPVKTKSRGRPKKELSLNV